MYIEGSSVFVRSVLQFLPILLLKTGVEYKVTLLIVSVTLLIVVAPALN
jgi:hypothetical protein